MNAAWRSRPLRKGKESATPDFVYSETVTIKLAELKKLGMREGSNELCRDRKSGGWGSVGGTTRGGGGGDF